MSKDNGGPAFPQSLVDTGKGSGIVTADELDVGGMSLRDYFAAKAMAAILAGSKAPEERYGEMLSIASRLAYLAADAMLAAREVDQ